MKKLTKSSLEELAQVMPVLSEKEQRMYMGSSGDVMALDMNGNVINDTAMLREQIPDYDKQVADTKNTYWYVFNGDQIVGNCVSEGTVKFNEVPSGYANVRDMEGTAVNRDVLQMLGESTDIEWMMFQNDSGYARLITEQRPDGVDYQIANDQNYNTVCHTHPELTGYNPRPSDEDRASTGLFMDMGIDKCMIYSDLTNSWIVYHGEADREKGEKYENEVRWE